MGKKKWKRIRLHDLACEETQREVLGLIEKANQQQGPLQAAKEVHGDSR